MLRTRPAPATTDAARRIVRPPAGSKAWIGPAPALVLLLSGMAFQTAPAQPQHFEQLLTPSEQRDYRKKTKYKDRMDLFRQLFRRYSDEIRRSVRAGHPQQTEETLGEIQTVCKAAMELSGKADDPKDHRSKQLKRLEIRLRKLIETLDDLKNSLSYEEREQFEITADALERLRSVLLGYFFGKSIAPQASGPPYSPPPGSSFAARSETAAAASSQRRRGSGINGDQFSEVEYEALQDAQDLLKRVKVLLAICQSRLDEVDRRREGREWKEKEPNPLEFFTYGQLMRAYSRALETVMINIDEKARFKTASEKDIRKSLEQVNEKVTAFLPRLEPIRQLALELRDEELHWEQRDAKRNSETALKGSQLGLGAPVK